MRLESASVTRVHGLDVFLDTARSLNDGDPLDVVLEQLVRAAARAVWRGIGEPGAASVWRLRGSKVSLEAGGEEAEADLRLLTGMAELGGLAVAAAVDFDLELRLAVAFELLPQMITGASGAEDADEAASVIVTRVGEVPGVDRVLLFMRGDLKRGLWIKASTDSVNLLRLEQDEGAVAQAVRERQIVVHNDGQPWRSEQDALIAGDNRHLLAVPVAVAEEVIGM